MIYHRGLVAMGPEISINTQPVTYINEKRDLINTLGGHLTSKGLSLNWLMSERINSKSQNVLTKKGIKHENCK